MDKIKLIYITTDNINAVQEGQVYKLLEYYQSQDIFSDIVLFQPYSNQAILDKARNMLSKYSFRREYFYARPLAPNKYYATIKSLKNLLAKEMTDNSVIHSRGNVTSPFIRKALPLQFKDAYILTEFRGLLLDELKVAHKHRPIDYMLAYGVKVPYARCILRKLYRDKGVHITAVSPLFKQLIEKEGVSAEKVCVHPNIVSSDFVFNEEHRREIREKYGLTESQLVAVMSSGGGSVWQKDQEVMKRLLQMGFVIFNLGKHKVEQEGVINEFLPRDLMPKYLAAADVAVLWRDDIPLNNVACPSKFGEFVTMGLYVIHNGSVAIAKEFIEKNEAGIIVSNPKDIQIDKLKLGLDVRRIRCKAGYDMFSVECIAKSYIDHYLNKN